MIFFDDTENLFTSLDYEDNQQQISLDFVANFVILIVFICINVAYAKQSLQNSIFFIPVQHKYHQNKPLCIQQPLLIQT